MFNSTFLIMLLLSANTFLSISLLIISIFFSPVLNTLTTCSHSLSAPLLMHSSSHHLNYFDTVSWSIVPHLIGRCWWFCNFSLTFSLMFWSLGHAMSTYSLCSLSLHLVSVLSFPISSNIPSPQHSFSWSLSINVPLSNFSLYQYYPYYYYYHHYYHCHNHKSYFCYCIVDKHSKTFEIKIST